MYRYHSTIKKLIFMIPTSGHMKSIILLIILIMFVNILNCLPSRTELIKSNATLRHPKTIQDDLQQLSSLNRHSSWTMGLLPQTNVTRDISTSISDIILDSSKFSPSDANKADALNDKDKKPKNSEPATSNQTDANFTTLSPLSTLKSTTTSNSIVPIVTTPSSIDSEDEVNRLYFQHTNINDEITTLPPVDTTAQAHSETKAGSGSVTEVDSRDKSKQTSTTSTPTDILHTEESKFILPKPTETSNIDEKSTESFVPPESLPEVASNLQNRADTTVRPQTDTTTTTEATAQTLQALSTLANLNGYQSSNPSQPSIGDLLFIVKHLNLGRQRYDAPKLLSDHHRSDIGIVGLHHDPSRILNQSWLSLDGPTRSQPLISTQIPQNVELQSLESHISNVNRLSKKESPVLKQKDEAISKFSLSDMSKNLVSINNRNDGRRLPPRSTKYALISPYTANFDSGLSFKNLPHNRRSPHAKNDSTEPAPEDDENSRQQKLYDKLRRFHESRVQNKNGDGSVKPDPSQKPVIRHSSDISGAQSHTKPVSSVSKTSENKSKVKSNTSKSSSNSINQSSGSSEKIQGYRQGDRIAMGKRDMKTSISTKRPTRVSGVEQQTISSKASQERVKDEVSHIKVHKININEDASTEDSRSYYDFPQLPELPELSISNGEKFVQQPVLNQFSIGGVNYHQLADDPHKKSLYYTTDSKSTNMYDMNSHYGFGEIANKHGVPFRLKSPLGESYHFDGLEDRIPNESSQYEDYVYSPYESSGGLQNGGYFKLDDELKKNIAIKTLEDPSLLANLLETLNGFDPPKIPNSSGLGTMAMKKLYTSVINPNNEQPDLYHSLSSNINPLSLILNNQIRHQSPITNSFAASDDSQIAVAPLRSTSNESGVNLMLTDIADKWALSRMPDLIPIPLAATVPGYLIRLPNGQVLAAALTNSFSIQGIQKGPLSASYKSFLNHRLKTLIKPSKSLSGANHIASDSGLRPYAVPAPNMFAQQTTSGKGGRKSGGWFTRGVVSQLGFTRLGQRQNATRDNGKARPSNSKYKPGKANGSPFAVPSLSDQELATLPLADPNEPVFSFADESQIVDSTTSVLPNGYLGPLPLPAVPANGPDSADLLQSASTLALRAKINQLLSLKSLLGDELVHGRRRRAALDKKSRIRPVAPLCHFMVSPNPPIRRQVSKH